MDIGIFGGTYNPVHNAHIMLANAVKVEFALDRLFLVVDNDPPHKQPDYLLPAATRYALVEQALAGLDGIFANDTELKRGGVSYTLDTLLSFRARFPDARLNLIVGADMLYDLPTWYKADEIFKLARIIGVARPGDASPTVAAERLANEHGARVAIASVRTPNISSTAVRERVAAALPITELVPEQVERMIYENGYYFPRNVYEMLARVRGMIKEKRFIHTCGVARTAIALANAYGADAQKARTVALLHDCAKSVTLDVALAQRVGIPADEPMELAHSKIGALYARELFGITDEEILDAIRYHTTGRAGMGRLEKIIYLADTIEPNRDFPAVAELRALAERDLDEAVRRCLEYSIRWVEQSGKKVDAATIEALAAL